MNIGYIYLLREREFIKSSENIYKIGYTNQHPNKRFNGYPRDSELLLLEKICNANIYEKLLIKKFKYEFINRRDIGAEYFEGNKNYMCNIILKVCNINQQTDLKKYNICRFKMNDSKPFETTKKIYSYNKDESYRRKRVQELQKEAYYDRLENEKFLKNELLILNRNKKINKESKTYTLNDVKKIVEKKQTTSETISGSDSESETTSDTGSETISDSTSKSSSGSETTSENNYGYLFGIGLATVAGYFINKFTKNDEEK